MTHRDRRGGISRRTLLKGLGLGTALAPLLPLLNAEAQAATGPKRLLLLYTPDGVGAADWNDSINWKPSGSATSFTLHQIHAPLQPFASKMVVPWGMRMTVAGAGEAHAHGMAGCWTASRLKGPGNGADFDGGNGNRTGWGSGPSIDQVVAENFGPDMPYQLGPDDANQPTRFRTFELGVESGNPSSLNRMIYKGDDQPVNPEADAGRAFDTIFDGVSPGGAQAPTVDVAAERSRNEDLALLDLDRATLAKIRTKIGSLDYDKVDRHLEALLELEQSIGNGTPTAAAAGCTIPDATGGGDFPAKVRTMMDIVAATYSCDLTRIMSLQLSRGFSDIKHGSWAPGAGNSGHHTYAHNGQDNTSEQTAIDNWYSSQVAYLLGLLDGTPEGSGTVLDNTLVCWGRELGNSAHQFYDYPGLMFGGAAGALQPGRMIDTGEAGHVKWLVSIANLMGLPIESFGNIDQDSGALDLG